MLRLVSYHLCPYVQRVAITALEAGVELDRVTIDLAAKPAWFTALSPTGKVPMLAVDGEVLFESAAIAEYINEISGGGLLPADPLDRARHRAWIEFASGTLADLAGLYSAADATGFGIKRQALTARFAKLDDAIAGPWFGGHGFGLVDAAFAPVFRYLDAFETLAGLELLGDVKRVRAWGGALAERASVISAVAPDYRERLAAFLRARKSYLSRLIADRTSSSAAPAVAA